MSKCLDKESIVDSIQVPFRFCHTFSVLYFYPRFVAVPLRGTQPFGAG